MIYGPYCTLYVLQLQTPDHWYVGTTEKFFDDRLAEHTEGRGAKWTKIHKVARVVKRFRVPLARKMEFENKTTLYYMRHVAKNWAHVRGGDFVWARNWYKPKGAAEFVRAYECTTPFDMFWAPQEFGGLKKLLPGY